MEKNISTRNVKPAPPAHERNCAYHYVDVDYLSVYLLNCLQFCSKSREEFYYGPKCDFNQSEIYQMQPLFENEMDTSDDEIKVKTNVNEESYNESENTLSQSANAYRAPDPGQDSNDDSDNEIRIITKSTVSRRIIQDSDSDSDAKCAFQSPSREISPTDEFHRTNSFKAEVTASRFIPDSDSDDETSPTLSAGPLLPSVSRLNSNDESDEETSIQCQGNHTNLHNSDSEDENPSACSGLVDRSNKGVGKSSRDKNKPRKAKQSALEEIHSETQRLVRQSRVSLPYHQPKQRSLAEFLSRKKVPIVPLKTTSEQLSEVWECIEEREKTAELFYNSESEESECNDDTKKSNIHVFSSPSMVKSDVHSSGDLNVNLNSEKTSLTVSQNDKDDTRGNSDIILDNSELTPVFCTEIQNTDISKINSSELRSVKSPEGSFHISDNSPSVPENLKPDTLHFDESKTLDQNLEPEKNIENIENVKLKRKLQCLMSSSLLEVNLDSMPKLSGTPNGFIDLDEGSEKPGALQLVTRFMKHAKLKPRAKKQEEKVNVSIAEVNAKGEVVNLSEEILTIKVGENTKPGETRSQLKAKLKEKMAQRREEEFAKRIEEYKLNEEFFEDTQKDELSENEEVDDDVDLSDSSETESEPEENDVDISDRGKKSGCAFLDEEAEEDHDEDEDIEEKGIDEDTCGTNDSNSCSVPSSLNVVPLLGGGNELSNDLDKTSTSDGQEGLLSLCSGGFPTQGLKLEDLEKNDEKQSEPFDLYLSEDAIGDVITNEKDSKNDLNSDSSDNEEIVSKKPKKKAVLTFSDEEDNEDDVSDMPPEYGFSDKEDSENELEQVADDGHSEEDNDLVDSEAEDNEQVADEEEEFITNPSTAVKQFLEDEAELSGSEYGSGDEDEVDMDKYEEEQGDKEKYNTSNLRTELEKFHMRNIIDDDKKEIRILQELLLEDGELHSDGPKRQRQFKWYNQDEREDGSFINTFDDDEDKIHGGEDEEDESWRKTRLEREIFLREMQMEEYIEGGKVKKFTKPEPKVGPPKNILPKPNPFKSPDPKKPFSLLSKRGSFLSRSDKILSKLAELTNISTSENPIGNSRGKRSMVFAVVSPPKEDTPSTEQTAKRKKTETLPAAKRLKFTTSNLNQHRVSVFEKLKSSEM